MVQRDWKNKGQLPVDVSLTSPKARVQAWIDIYYKNDTQSFDSKLMRTIKVVSAEACDVAKDAMGARCTFELEVLPDFCNPMGNMHGGCVALLADMATTMTTAPVSQEGFWLFGGVSRTLNVTYLQPVVGGTTVVIECMLRQIGKRLSVTQCLIRDKESGRLLAMAEHGKSALDEQDLTKAIPRL